MTFHFNPSLWFVCKLCRESFPDTDKLKAHKLESHLGESLNIKCIVFEEKLLDHEWIPSSQEVSSESYQLINENDASTQESNDDPTNVKVQVPLNSQHNSKFINPYVSLKVLTAHELNSASATASGTTNIGGENRKLFLKRKLNSVAESLPCPSKFSENEDSDEDDAHKNKIRELLSNAVIIKSEPNNNSNDGVFLQPQDLPISIVSTYSIPSSSNSKVINSVHKNVLFNSLQRQTNQLVLRENGKGFVQSPLTAFDVANSPFVPQILPTFVMHPHPEPEEICSYPNILNANEQHIEVKGEAGSDYLNTFHAPLPAQPPTTSMTNVFTGKVEFVEYDSIVNPDVKIGTTKQPTQISHVNHNLSLSTSRRRRSDKKIQKRYFCQICSASFGRNYHLTQHKVTHSNYRPFECPACDSKFKTKSTLRGHLVSVHGQVSDFRCHVCGKYFPSKKELTCHEPAHSRERPHLCDFPNCGAQFKSPKSLYVHTRMQHGKDLGLEQFQCPTCGKTFGLRKVLNVHQRKAHQTPDVQILS